MPAELVQPNGWILLPFVLLLGAIALGPVAFPNWWHKYYPHVSWGLGAITLCYYLLELQATAEVGRVAHEYVSFIVLVGSLFVVAGGIHITVKGEASPAANVLFLFVGAIAANVLGTTGASMLLLGPWIRMNRYRITEYHIVFFIFIISNIGGCLTPVGDPPLFLGYLQGVPFWWVTQHCWPMWLLGMGFLLGLFYMLDLRNYRRAPDRVRTELAGPAERWRFEGLWNVVWLLVILGAIFISHPLFLREGIMLAAALASYFTTSKRVHTANHFTFYPIQEVAILFSGIFATMMPALDWLEVKAPQWGTPSPPLFYWATGGLSSCLDNAPTYLSFLSAAHGAFGPSSHQASRLPLENSAFAQCLLAISISSVFFGAATYIGNGPNFMVKAIAHQQKAKCPSFIKFVTHYTVPYLAPLLVLLWLIFFRTA